MPSHTSTHWYLKLFGLAATRQRAERRARFIAVLGSFYLASLQADLKKLLHEMAHCARNTRLLPLALLV